MKAEEFYKQRSNSIRELWALSPKQIEYIALIMEEYAALHQPPVMGRSEQLQNCNCKRFEQRIDGRFYCRDCGKVEYTVL